MSFDILINGKKWCRGDYSMQGVSQLDFITRMLEEMRTFITEQESKNSSFEWEGFRIYCGCCNKLKPQTVRFLGREEYVKIKRHALFYPEHCIHCDPSGIIKA